VILGGRLGYVLFYKPMYFLDHPLEIFAVWQGGMSFHGGLLGVMAALALFAYTRKRPFLEVTDLVAPCVPTGFAAGRIGNFINGELWGKATSPDAPWAVIVDGQARHPSQLYEAFLEGVVLFLVLWFYSRKPRPAMATSALFLIVYGIGRFLVEFVRVPDQQLGYLALGWVTMGQVLSLPMIIVGVILFVLAHRRAAEVPNAAVS